MSDTQALIEDLREIRDFCNVPSRAGWAVALDEAIARLQSLDGGQPAPVAEAITPELRIAELSDQLQASQCAEKMTADLLKDAKARIAALEASGKAQAALLSRAIHSEAVQKQLGKWWVDDASKAINDHLRAILPKESDHG